jgi:hypothetical protein
VAQSHSSGVTMGTGVAWCMWRSTTIAINTHMTHWLKFTGAHVCDPPHVGDVGTMAGVQQCGEHAGVGSLVINSSALRMSWQEHLPARPLRHCHRAVARRNSLVILSSRPCAVMRDNGETPVHGIAHRETRCSGECRKCSDRLRLASRSFRSHRADCDLGVNRRMLSPAQESPPRPSV